MLHAHNVFARWKEISEKSLELTRIDAMEMTSTLTIIDQKGRERVRQTTTASKKFGETTKIITKFISPADVKVPGCWYMTTKTRMMTCGFTCPH